MWDCVSFHSFVGHVDCATALLRAALTLNDLIGVGTPIEVVVDCQLFTLLDSPQGVVEDPASDEPDRCIWVARMIDELSPAAVCPAVNAPVGGLVVPPDTPDVGMVFQPLGLRSIEKNARVLYDVVLLRDVLIGDHAPAMNGRLDEL